MRTPWRARRSKERPLPPLPERRPETGLGLRLRGVTKVFEGGVEVLGGLDLDVSPGEFLALLGPSGSGKTTLLRCLAGIEGIDAGSLERLDEEVPGASGLHRDMAFVFQSPHLMPWRSVLRNVELPLELAGFDRNTRRAAAEEALEQVQLADAALRYPAQLSGGMAMRVSLARALVTKPRLLLMDEPFGALDELTRMTLDERLHELWAERRPTVVFVTHSCAEAAFLSQRAVVLSPRPARIALDHRVALPDERTPPLRSDPAFYEQTDHLFRALATGMRSTSPNPRGRAR